MARKNERGSVLFLTAILSLLIAGMATAYSVIAYSEVATASKSLESKIALNIAEAGIAAAVTELNANRDYDGGGIGTVSGSLNSGTYSVTCAATGTPDEYSLTVNATFTTVKKGIQVIVALATTPVTAHVRGAITANGPVQTLGSIQVDGRDWNYTNTAIVGPGTNGISSRSTVTVGGASSVGGNGLAPIVNAPAASGVFEQNAVWGDGIDNDHDGSTDEEAYDGVDNDGDGRIDEDTIGYPTSPDAALGFAPNTLKETAQAQGTYVTSKAQYDALLAANGGNLPGGKVIYLDFDSLNPTAFGPAMNDDPSIIVMHNAAGNALMKDLHGQFKGLIMADDIVHVNGDATILGAIWSFSPFTHGNAYGNGAAIVRFSSAVLANLPHVTSESTFYEQKSWREVNVAQ